MSELDPTAPPAEATAAPAPPEMSFDDFLEGHPHGLRRDKFDIDAKALRRQHAGKQLTAGAWAAIVSQHKHGRI